MLLLFVTLCASAFHPHCNNSKGTTFPLFPPSLEHFINRCHRLLFLDLVSCKESNFGFFVCLFFRFHRKPQDFPCKQPSIMPFISLPWWIAFTSIFCNYFFMTLIEFLHLWEDVFNKMNVWFLAYTFLLWINRSIWISDFFFHWRQVFTVCLRLGLNSFPFTSRVLMLHIYKIMAHISFCSVFIYSRQKGRGGREEESLAWAFEPSKHTPVTGLLPQSHPF